MAKRLFLKTHYSKNQARTKPAVLLSFLLFIVSVSFGNDLYIGKSEANITPVLPVALDGQFHLRIAETARTPLLANVLVLESRNGNKIIDQAVFVACDLVGIPLLLTEMVRQEVRKKIPELEASKIIISATHTHTGPVTVRVPSWGYNIPKEGVSQPEDYQKLFTHNVTEAIVSAWKARKPGSVTWGQTYANVGRNRRAIYEWGPNHKSDNRTSIYLDGTARMYGNTNMPEFRSLEGYEDHDVNTLFFWDKSGKLIATSVQLACPSQEVEGDSAVDADFWHAVRTALKQHFGADMVIMGWCGASGDQSPHLMYGRKAEERMRKLQHLNRIDAIAKQIVKAVVESYEIVKDDRYTDVQLGHTREVLQLPMRMVTKEEYEDSKRIVKETADQTAADPKMKDKILAKMTWYDAVVQRYEMQKTNPAPTYDAEIHVVRLGDIVICTNPFELFTDYGIRIQARSKALQTFTIQLAGPGTYLPTAKAVEGGSYSAIVQSNQVGPEGGQVLVNETVKHIDFLWQTPSY